MTAHRASTLVALHPSAADGSADASRAPTAPVPPRPGGARPRPAPAAPDADLAVMSDADARDVRQAAALHQDHPPRWSQWLLDPWSDERTTAAMRLLLALVALVVTVAVDPARTRISLLHGALALYAAYSAVVYAIVRRELAPRLPAAHWIDTACYTAFTALAGGLTSPFFSFYYFAILTASFRGGMRGGVQVAVASAVLFCVVGFAIDAMDGIIALNRLILRPGFLLVIGFMLARWANVELVLKRRLVLLKEVSALANPRFGEGQTIGSVLDRLREFHDADAALLAVADARGRRFLIRHARRDSPGGGAVATPLPHDPGRMLTSLPWDQAVVFHDRDSRAIELRSTADGSATGNHGTPPDRRRSADIAAVLDCRSFVSVPLRFDESTMGRLYLTSRIEAAFEETDAAFLTMVIAQVMPAVERLRLLDRLALDAAAQERQRLSRDLHDTVIQPYIGLQMGIAAALQQARSGTDALPILERLLHICDREIATLRQYGRDLKSRRPADGGLVSALNRIANSFAEASDLRVEVNAPATLVVEDRLAAEVFQLVAEGISNIRRHTSAAQADVTVERDADHLLIRIENEGTGEAFIPFVPRSIRGRALALGGSVQVLGRADGGASVRVAIPV